MKRKLIKIGKKYIFKIDEENRKVIGYLLHKDKKPTIRVIKCSKDDHWDPIIGIAVAKLRLDLTTPEHEYFPHPSSWSKTKKHIQESLK